MDTAQQKWNSIAKAAIESMPEDIRRFVKLVDGRISISYAIAELNSSTDFKGLKESLQAVMMTTCCNGSLITKRQMFYFWRTLPNDHPLKEAFHTLNGFDGVPKVVDSINQSPDNTIDAPWWIESGAERAAMK